jgi:hypothetical protein
MPGKMLKDFHFWWSGFGGGIVFLIAAAFLLWMLLNDWARLITQLPH